MSGQATQDTTSAAAGPLSVVDIGGGAGDDLEVGQKQRNEIDYDALPDEYQEALDADDFVVYGKASIEQYDVEDQRLTMDALTAALDRFFESDDAPGIISRAHADVPVGRPIREHTLDDDTTLVIDGEEYQYEAGDTIRTEAKDADDDGLPELWLVSRLANDSELARETRLRALQGDLNGFSVTVYPREAKQTDAGEDVTELDLHAVTIGTDEQIKNKGSEFDVAEFKALRSLPDLATKLADGLSSTIDMDNEERNLLARLLQRSGEQLEEGEEQTDGADDAEQKASESGSGDESLASPIYQAVESDTLTAKQAQKLESATEKMDPGVVKPIIDAISEGNLEVENALDMLSAMSGGTGETEKSGSHDDEDEMDEEDKADTDDSPAGEKGDTNSDAGDSDAGAEQKASAEQVAQTMADRFDIPVDEVMEHLENLEKEAEDKDDAGELKAAAAAAAEKAVDDKVDEAVEAKLDEALPDDIASTDDIDQKLDDAAERVGSEVEDALQKAETTITPSPGTSEGNGGNTLGDVISPDGGEQ